MSVVLDVGPGKENWGQSIEQRKCLSLAHNSKLQILKPTLPANPCRVMISLIAASVAMNSISTTTANIQLFEHCSSPCSWHNCYNSVGVSTVNVEDG